jgi:hypothetical protein
MSRLSTAQTRKVLALNKPFGLTKRHMVVAEVGTGAAISECPVSQNAPCRNPARPEIRPFRPNGPAKRRPGAPICEIRMTPPRHRVRARATQRDRKGRHCNLGWGVARFLNRNTRKRRASWSPLSRAPPAGSSGCRNHPPGLSPCCANSCCTRRAPCHTCSARRARHRRERRPTGPQA